MSGGSFDYLSVNELERVLTQGEQIAEMADQLRLIGYPDLAQATLDWREKARKFHAELEEELRRLQTAWYGVEWWRSCDASYEDAVAACKRARKERHDAIMAQIGDRP